jgi:hypothetical protein
MRNLKHIKKFESFYEEEGNRMDDYMEHSEEIEKKQQEEVKTHKPSEMVLRIASLPHLKNAENRTRLVNHLKQKLDVIIKLDGQNDLEFTHPRDKENSVTVIYDGAESIDAVISSYDLVDLLENHSNEI